MPGLTFDDVLTLLRPYKGQFELVGDSGYTQVRHKTRVKVYDGDRCPMCPLAVQAEDKLRRAIWNTDIYHFRTVLGGNVTNSETYRNREDVVSQVLRCADSPNHPRRTDLLEALL